MKILLTTLLLAVTAIACNCHYEGSGYIYDAATKKPMVNVLIDVYSTKPWKDTIAPKIYTDSNGYYSYSHDYCYDLMSAYYEGYIRHTFSKEDRDTIFLERLETLGDEY